MCRERQPAGGSGGRRTFLRRAGLAVAIASQGGCLADRSQAGDATGTAPSSVTADEGSTPSGAGGDSPAGQPARASSSDGGPSPYPGTDWRLDPGGSVYHTEPVLEGERVYLAVTTDTASSAGEGFVAAYDSATGERVWRQDEFPAPDTPIYSDGRLYFATRAPEGTDDGGLYAIDADSGEVAWRRTDHRRWTTPVVADGVVVYATSRGGAYGLDATTGETRWQTADVGGLATDYGNGALSHAGNTVFLADGTALDAADGAVRWSVDGESLLGDPTTDGDRVYYTRTDAITGDDATVTVEARSPVEGEVRWTHTVADGNRWDGDVTVADDRVFFLSTSGESTAVRALDAASGSVDWTARTTATLRGTPAVADGTVYVGGWYVPGPSYESGRAVVYALDAGTGDRTWAYLLDSEGLETAPRQVPAADTPIVADGRLLVATHPARATRGYQYVYYANVFALGSRTDPPEANLLG